MLKPKKKKKSKKKEEKTVEQPATPTRMGGMPPIGSRPGGK